MSALIMALDAIKEKKGRSFLTMLGIIIGIAAVMTIVSAINGYTTKTMEQYAAMGSNKLTVYIWNYLYDEKGNSLGKDYFPALYDYCSTIKEYVVGVTPQANCEATVVYGTKSSANMQYNYDDKGNPIGDFPPSIYYVSDQYSICNNLTVTKGRDLSMLDCQRYNQVCVLGATAAKAFFDGVDPVGKEMQFNGQSFEVIGVYGSRVGKDNPNGQNMDNFILVPYTARRVLGGAAPEQFIVKARDSASMIEASTRIGGFLKGLVDPASGGFNVDKENSWQDYQNQQMGMISMILGGIAAISLLVGGIGIMNIMLVTVTERTREIGIRRAIGAERASIITQFLIEAAMLCGIGGVFGILVGTGGSLLVGRLMFKMTIFPAVWITLCAFTLSVALGILFGIYPAVKASKLQPVEALRAE
mgnify:FL=1